MSLSGNVLGITTYAKAREIRKTYIRPAATSNGVWMSQGQYSMQGGGGLSSTESVYCVFNGEWTDYCNSFNEGAYVEICLPKSTKIDGCDMTSSDGFFPATGEVYYSDEKEEIKKTEIPMIKDIAINWINYVLKNNSFNASDTESFEVRKKLIMENLFMED